MDRADVATLSNTMREAFLGSGRDVAERKTVTGNAFLVSGRAIGQFEERGGTLRVRLWLGDKERAAFEGRPTFDRDSGWLHVISDEDVKFVCGLAAAAYRAAASGKAAPPSARSVELPSSEMPARVPPEGSEEKKKGAPRRPAARSMRPRA
jgi:hypothetical protein